MGKRILTEESLLFSSLFEDSWPTVDSRLSGGRALDNISAKFVPESTLAARSRARVISSVNEAVSLSTPIWGLFFQATKTNIFHGGWDKHPTDKPAARSDPQSSLPGH